MGFVLIIINKIVLYNFRIEHYQMRLVFLTRIDMNFRSFDEICASLILSKRAITFTYISN